MKVKEKQMTMQSNFRQLNTIAKQVGFMPSCWLAINSLSGDRTPGEHYAQGSIGGGSGD
jgi:hypothetical protein